MKRIETENKGFTLIELMITLAISSIVMTGIYAIYNAQSTARRNQKIVVDMMQNLRAGLYYMEREIRVAGFDPQRTTNAGITIANLSDIRFTLDDNQDGDLVAGAGTDPNERIHYMLSDDADGDGIANAPGCNLQRQDGAAGAFETIANNIDALQFFYFDNNGATTTNINNIATVQIAMVARGGSFERSYSNNRTYSVTLIDGTNVTVLPAQNDNIRREMLTTSVRCRNL
ncbi:MAG: prepilin-type N-terminal cleavage/methylation domain-containing protein [Deltaproteobacteria bacterium]|nr:prepilin-type N-terminal cleavage/methylation domain-containing protein [Deltaproteobacteria bacterium]